MANNNVSVEALRLFAASCAELGPQNVSHDELLWITYQLCVESVQAADGADAEDIYNRLEAYIYRGDDSL